MFFNLRWKCCKQPLVGGDHQVTKINTTFFVGNEVSNIFHLTIFSSTTIFSKITARNNFGRRDYFLGKGTPDDKNEYNHFYGKWDTKCGLEVFFSKKPIPSKWKLKIRFWGHIFPHSGGSIRPVVFENKTIRFTHVWTYTNPVNFMKIISKPQPVAWQK